MPEIADWIARHVAPGQRVPLMRLIVTPDDASYEPIGDWINQPFAPWAAMPDGYVFPEALVNAFIAPAEAVTMAGVRGVRAACPAVPLRPVRGRRVRLLPGVLLPDDTGREPRARAGRRFATDGGEAPVAQGVAPRDVAGARGGTRVARARPPTRTQAARR
jgi:hypothetical protein